MHHHQSVVSFGSGGYEAIDVSYNTTPNPILEYALRNMAILDHESPKFTRENVLDCSNATLFAACFGNIVQP